MKLAIEHTRDLQHLAREIRSHYDAAVALSKSARDRCNEAVAEAILCGEVLTRARNHPDMKHGKWLPWLKEHCREVCQETARKYMALANSNHGGNLNGKGLRQAYISAGIISDEVKQDEPEQPRVSLAPEATAQPAVEPTPETVTPTPEPIVEQAVTLTPEPSPAVEAQLEYVVTDGQGEQEQREFGLLAERTVQHVRRYWNRPWFAAAIEDLKAQLDAITS